MPKTQPTKSITTYEPPSVLLLVQKDVYLALLASLSSYDAQKYYNCTDQSSASRRTDRSKFLPPSVRKNTEEGISRTGLGTDCVFCQRGKYAPATGYNECKVCVTGTHAASEGAVECNQCEVGKHSNVTGSENCLKCGGGTFTDYEGAVVCQPCPQHMAFNETEQKCTCLPTFTLQLDDTCSCKAGETLMGTKCEPCETAKWKAGIGITSCNLCADTLKGFITEEVGSTKVGDCKCPMGTHDNENGVCTEVQEGMDVQEIGMSLANLKLDPGQWCTGPTSIENSAIDTVVTLVVLFIGAVFFGLLLCRIKKFTKDLKGLAKRLKNGGKIIFAATQIMVTLTSIIPAMLLPENVKEALKAANFLNVDLFNMVLVGCWIGGIDYYSKVLVMTLTIIFVCEALISTGVAVKKHRSWCFATSIAITYLLLPTITTSIFGLFPCDSLDNDSSMLRKDYTISCDGG